MNEQDRRKYRLEITPQGKRVIEILPNIITNNRTKSFIGITKSELNQLNIILNKIKIIYKNSGMWPILNIHSTIFDIF